MHPSVSKWRQLRDVAAIYGKLCADAFKSPKNPRSSAKVKPAGGPGSDMQG
jgi:hypothetical protein